MKLVMCVSILCAAQLVFCMNRARVNCKERCEHELCPCSCYKDEVRCEDKGISKVMKLPRQQRINSFDLSYNNITSILRKSFAFKSVRRVKHLRLTSNKITHVADKSFAKLKHLETLFLNHNNITNINESMFLGLRKIKRLYLDHNHICEIEDNAFQPLAGSIELLYLHKNEIQFLNEKTFNKLLKLRVLDLSANKLMNINFKIVLGLGSLKFIFVGKNPWSCLDKQKCIDANQQPNVTLTGLKCKQKHNITLSEICLPSAGSSKKFSSNKINVLLAHIFLFLVLSFLV